MGEYLILWTGIFLISLFSAFTAEMQFKVDERGYIVFCPCMGRFGNQADQFLGTLNFAKELDRTLVLPHWIEYQPYTAGSNQIPFDKYFKVEPLNVYHRVILMNDFMEYLAPAVWPEENRTIFCYTPRQSIDGNTEESCNAKEGNPFGPYWNKFNVDFVKNEFHKPILYTRPDHIEEWKRRYTSSKWPVIAFVGQPASFPVSAENSLLHKYLEWSDDIMKQGEAIIETHLERPYLGVHLRIGSDWKNACRHVKEGSKNHVFSSPQCLGEKFQNGLLTVEMCLPSEETVIQQMKSIIKTHKIKSVFLARDSTDYDNVILKNLKKSKISYYSLEGNNPHLDLYILGQSDHYIGNCVSSFSSFVTRERRAKGLESNFWAFSLKTNDKDEL